MPEAIYVFLDFDDTLSDSALLREQYVCELANLLAGEFGGEEAAWMAALVPELESMLANYAGTFTRDPYAGYNDWLAAERARMAEAVFARTGIPFPASESPDALAKRMQFDALTGCKATFPGAEEALRALFEMGARTQIASAQESEYLLAALMGAGIESYTESKYGPDLVDCAKESPEFYRRIFESCGVRPSEAIVIDDQPICLDWAEETGAKVVQACIKAGADVPEFPIILRNLSELPNLVRQLTGT